MVAEIKGPFERDYRGQIRAIYGYNTEHAASGVYKTRGAVLGSL